MTRPRDTDPANIPDRETAGRSADARGDTGTDADFLAERAEAGDVRDMGGIPSTTDSALSPSMSGSSDLASRGPIDRERPAPMPDRRNPAAGQGRRRTDRPATGPRHKDGPLESLGKAVSAPVRGAADPDADEKPE